MVWVETLHCNVFCRNVFVSNEKISNPDVATSNNADADISRETLHCNVSTVLNDKGGFGLLETYYFQNPFNVCNAKLKTQAHGFCGGQSLGEAGRGNAH